MAFPSVQSRSEWSAFGNTAYIQFDYTGTINAGDLLVGFGAIGGTSNSVSPSTLTELLDTNNSGSNDCFFIGYMKASGGESGNFTETATSGRACSILMHFQSMADPATTPPEVSSVASGISQAPQSNSLNPAGWGTEDTLWIDACHISATFGNSSYSSLPAGYANLAARTAVGTSGGNIDSYYVAIAVGDDQNAVASQSPGTWSLSIRNKDWLNAQVAIPPSGIGGGGVPNWNGTATYTNIDGVVTFTDINGVSG